MALTLFLLLLAVVCFGLVLEPLFGPRAEIPQTRSRHDVELAVSRSVQELHTDLDLQKIQAEDLEHIQRFLEEESSR